MTCIATFMYPLAAASVILASLKYKSSAIISAFNVMVNYRLKFNLQGFEQYGVNLLGQRIKSNQEYIDQNFVNHYFYYRLWICLYAHRIWIDFICNNNVFVYLSFSLCYENEQY